MEALFFLAQSREVTNPYSKDKLKILMKNMDTQILKTILSLNYLVRWSSTKSNSSKIIVKVAKVLCFQSTLKCHPKRSDCGRVS